MRRPKTGVLASGGSWLLLGCTLAIASGPTGNLPADFAYRMAVVTQADAAAYRIAVPLSVYRKVVNPELADIRVFNAKGELVPFAVERPESGTVAGVATALPLFMLKDDSSQTLDAVRVTIESGRAAINLQSAGNEKSPERINTYIADGRAIEASIAALRLEWPDDSADFAGRLRVEAGDTLGDWRFVTGAAPVANLHSGGRRLMEQRVEFPPTRAKYWRLSWVAGAAPFVLTSVQAEPARRSVDAHHAQLSIEASRQSPGKFEYDLGSGLPVDRINLALPDANTMVEADLQSRARPSDPWVPVRRSGFYRLKNGAGELRNGPVAVGLSFNRYWLVSADPKAGGLGSAPPRLEVEWVPHEVVFVARGAAPFYLAYGSATAESASVSLAMLPKNLTVAIATLAEPESLGGDDRLRSPATPFAWKKPLLWAVLIAGAVLLAWMAWRLARDVSKA